MMVTEESVERALRRFFVEARLPVSERRLRQDRASYLAEDLRIMRRCVPAFMAALNELETVSPCQGFDADEIFGGGS